MRFQSTLSMRRATCRRPSWCRRQEFQSTLSMRRATLPRCDHLGCEHISIHALHEESDSRRFVLSNEWTISIHALHEESDDGQRLEHDRSDQFQSTLSMRRATLIHVSYLILILFQSTLSMRRATAVALMARLLCIFQSTLSMRRATKAGLLTQSLPEFQSTLSMRRATNPETMYSREWLISIHALHEESD